MSLKRTIIDMGERISHFFAQDLQNIYYKHLFLSNAKKNIGEKEWNRNPRFCNEARKWWKHNYSIRINTLWHDYYSSQNGIEDVRYIPENLYYAYIEPFYNQKPFAKAIDDKCFYSERFPPASSKNDFTRPKIILRNVDGMFFDTNFNILKLDEAVLYLANQHEGFVVKESITGTGGNRIVFVEPGKTLNVDECRDLFRKYNKNYVVESIIVQCHELSDLNPSSVNTIRFITFMNNDGVHLLSAVMRIGGADSRTDNFSTGGISCGIDDNGVLKDTAYNQQYQKYQKHPSGREFSNKIIPSFDKAKKIVLDLHRRFGHFRIISWDIAINEEYVPVVLEYNLTPQSIDLHQINNGPLFGKLTEHVLNEVFGKKTK